MSIAKLAKIGIGYFEKGAFDSIGKFTIGASGHAFVMLNKEIYSFQGVYGFKKYDARAYLEDNINKNRGRTIVHIIDISSDDHKEMMSLIHSNCKIYTGISQNCSTEALGLLSCFGLRVTDTNPQKITSILEKEKIPNEKVVIENLIKSNIDRLLDKFSSRN